MSVIGVACFGVPVTPIEMAHLDDHHPDGTISMAAISMGISTAQP